jgi:hypothetical protein
MHLVLPGTTSAGQGDSLPLPAGGYECDNCGDVRDITAGSIVAGASTSSCCRDE